MKLLNLILSLSFLTCPMLNASSTYAQPSTQQEENEPKDNKGWLPILYGPAGMVIVFGTIYGLLKIISCRKTEDHVLHFVTGTKFEVCRKNESGKSVEKCYKVNDIEVSEDEYYREYRQKCRAYAEEQERKN